MQTKIANNVFARLRQISIHTLSKYSVDQNKITYIFAPKSFDFLYKTLFIVNKKNMRRMGILEQYFEQLTHYLLKITHEALKYSKIND